MAVDFKNKGVYDFSVYPTIIGTQFRNAAVLGVVSYTVATSMADLTALHQQYYSYLPAGTPDDPTLFDYIIFKLESGEITVLANVWIKESTIIQANSFPMQIILEKVGPSDIPKIRDMLTVKGFSNYTIKNMNSGEILKS